MRESNAFGGENKLDLQTIMLDFIESCVKAGFGDRIVLKGGMNLDGAMLAHLGQPLARLTRDIDFHINSKSVWENFIEEVPKTISQNSPSGIGYSVNGRRGFEKNPNSDSAYVLASNGVEFSVDMNISDFVVKPSIYVEGRLPGYSLEDMIADKVKVFFSPKIYRRVKDAYDLYHLAQLQNYDLAELADSVRAKSGKLEIVLPEFDQLEHAYSKFRGAKVKIDFNELMQVVMRFCSKLAEEVNNPQGRKYVWKREHLQWINYS